MFELVLDYWVSNRGNHSTTLGRPRDPRMSLYVDELQGFRYGIVMTAVARGVQAEHVPDAPAALEHVRRRWAASEVDGATQDHANAERNGR
jgi:hypothetical protein